MESFRNIILCFVFLFSSVKSQASNSTEDHVINATKIFHELLIDYDFNVRPLYGEKPVLVGLNLYFLDVSVDTANMEWSATVYFRQRWNDPRLAFQDAAHKITLYPPYNIWTPDPFFANAKRASQVKMGERGSGFARITHNGDVLTSSKLRVTMMAPMDFRKFPFDTQICSMHIESYGHVEEDVKFTWFGERRTDLRHVHIAGWKLDEIITGEMSAVASTGVYQRVNLQLKLVRSGNALMRRMVMPSALLGALMWFSLWIPHRAVYARMTTLFVLVAMQVVVIYCSEEILPHVGYLTLMDHWRHGILAFAVIATFAFGLANAVSYCPEEKIRRKRGGCLGRLWSDNDRGAKVDIIFRVLYFCGYVLFHIVFWAAVHKERN